MMNRRHLCVFGVALIAAALASPSPAAEPKKPSPKERAALIGKLKSAEISTRLEGVRAAVDYVQPDGAKLLLQLGLHDAEDNVRRTAYDSLLALKEKHEVCDFLVDQLNREARHTPPDSTTPLLLALLLSSDLADVSKATDRYVQEKLAGNHGANNAAAEKGAAFVVAMADMLASHADKTDLVPLTRLTKSTLFDKFPVRRSIVQALVQIDDIAAIDTLMGLLAKLDGEVRADAIEYLQLVTKQQFIDPVDWTTWWAANKEMFQFPAGLVRPEKRSLENLAGGASHHYYGLPLYGKKLVFVIDSSGSMMGPRLAAAKRELINAIQNLKDEVEFDIVEFNSHVTYWKRRLTPAGSLNKREAERFVQQIDAGETTATYEAIQAALYLNAEAIYLLTDGIPEGGRVSDTAQIVELVTRQNRSLRVSIYTIGIAPPTVLGGGSPFDDFLQALADRNWGLYRRVDE